MKPNHDCRDRRELVVTPSLVRGRSVLEIGAGVGLCGLLAAKLGASEARPPTALSPSSLLWHLVSVKRLLIVTWQGCLDHPDHPVPEVDRPACCVHKRALGMLRRRWS